MVEKGQGERIFQEQTVEKEYSGNDIDEVTSLTAALRLASALALLRPDLIKHLNFLEERNLTQDIAQAVRANPYKRRLQEKKYYFELLKTVLPENLLISINTELQKLNEFDGEKMQDQTRCQGLYHLIEDSRLLEVIRGGFKRIDERKKGATNVGSLEMHLGLAGMFCSYGKIWDFLSIKMPDNNLLVYPFEIAKSPNTVCITNELSLDFLFDCVVKERMREITDHLSLESPLSPSVSQNAEITPLLLLVSIMSQVIPPAKLGYKDYPSDSQELCINLNEITLPQMIIVAEDPGYFYDEAEVSMSQFITVPIIDDENVLSALDELGVRTSCRDHARTSFVELVNGGVVDLERWSYKPTHD